MFKISYTSLLSGALHKSLAKLMQAPGETSAVFNVLRCSRRLNTAMQEAAEVHKTLAKEFVVMENGEPKLHEKPTPMMPFAIQEGMEEAFTKKMEEFLKIEVEINSQLVNLHDFPSFKPTALDLEALAPILVEDQR